MTLFIEKTGDLFTSDAPALAHGVNTAGLMGAGIAVAFKRKWPDMYLVYKIICKNGTFKPGQAFPYEVQDPTVRTVYNLASQDDPGPNARLEWLESSVREMLKDADCMGINRIAMPRIGCGIGGLDWEDVRDILEHYATTQLVDLEVWTL